MKCNLMTTTAAAFLMGASMAAAQQPSTSPPATTVAPILSDLMSSIPSGSVTVTNWYKQNIYDATNTKVGDIDDVLVSPSDGKITALIVGVGGFLGMGEKHVVVSFNAIKRTVMDNKNHLTIATSKDALAAARNFKYDSKTSTWVADTVSAK